MAKQWTDEERKAASEKAKARLAANKETTAETKEEVVAPVVNEAPSINKVEDFNRETPTNIEEYNRLKLDEEDKIQSMLNTIKILPPNMIRDGRHLKENVQAICGFMVTEELMDKVYANFKHEF